MNQICYHGNQTIRRTEILQKKTLKIRHFQILFFLTAKVNINDTYSD